MKKLLFIVVLVTFPLIMSGCSDDEVSVVEEINIYQPNKDDDERITKEHKDEINIALASVISPAKSRSKYELLLDYLGEKLDKQINIIQKETYAEVNELLRTGGVDIAFICSLSYVLASQEGYIEGLVSPEVKGTNLYQSYVIVKKDSPYHSLQDLNGQRFAYTDPLSYSGKLSVLKMLDTMEIQESSFFKETFYTYSHDYSIKSVDLGIVEGASVDSALFEQMRRNNDKDVQNLKIIEAGEKAGMPPVVASVHTNEKIKKEVKEILLNLNQTEEGNQILKEIQIDRYIPLKNDDYTVISEILHLMEDE